MAMDKNGMGKKANMKSKKVGKGPMKAMTGNKKNGNGGLTAAQKKLPPALQKAILKKKK